MDKANVHSVLSTGACTTCHDAHGSNARHMLKADGNAACYSCHRRETFEKKVVHAVVAKDGCLACHVAHASAEKELLSAPEGALCGKCHAPAAPAFQKAHAKYPVATCTGCHDPHSADANEAPQGVGPPARRRLRVRLVPRGAHVREAVRGDGRRREALRELPRGGEARRRRPGAARAREARRVPRVPRSARLRRAEARQGGRDAALRPMPRGPGARRSAVPHKAATGPDGCRTCHAPHAAKEKRLLVKKPEALCASLPREDDPGRQPEGDAHAVRGRRLRVLPRSARVQPEGHDHRPAGQAVLRVPHGRRAPVHEGRTPTGPCWRGSAPPATRPTAATSPSSSRRAGWKLCKSCHEPLFRDAGRDEPQAVHRRRVPELPRSARLRRARPAREGPEGALPQVPPEAGAGARVEERARGLRGRGSARKCHNPHKAGLKNLLVAKAPDLCLSCHKALQRAAREREEARAGRRLPHLPPAARREPTRSSSSQTVSSVCDQCHSAKDKTFAVRAPRHRREQDRLRELPRSALVEGPEAVQEGGTPTVRRAAVRGAATSSPPPRGKR